MHTCTDLGQSARLPQITNPQSATLHVKMAQAIHMASFPHVGIARVRKTVSNAQEMGIAGQIAVCAYETSAW